MPFSLTLFLFFLCLSMPFSFAWRLSYHSSLFRAFLPFCLRFSLLDAFKHCLNTHTSHTSLLLPPSLSPLRVRCSPGTYTSLVYLPSVLLLLSFFSSFPSFPLLLFTAFVFPAGALGCSPPPPAPEGPAPPRAAIRGGGGTTNGCAHCVCTVMQSVWHMGSASV